MVSSHLPTRGSHGNVGSSNWRTEDTHFVVPPPSAQQQEHGAACRQQLEERIHLGHTKQINGKLQSQKNDTDQRQKEKEEEEEEEET
ncbi:hypothetical protein Baya_4293 [Bagarius yarrelli]|uniref:Uncharacterized protein n=1 Tax=Bagarius yarrelli TaxID=175774 RepID=A0A556TVY8_BAGYA|nr:hypothetical protein Baya_4293 [Bagarius yarrelli]